MAPKKRVISDEHWMKNRRRSPPGKGSTIPKNFLQATAVNPPVERKIEDWVKRMASPEPPEKVETPKRKVRRAESEESEEKPKKRKVSRRSPVGDGIRARPSRSPSPDDKIRIKPSKDRPRAASSRTPSKLDANPGIGSRWLAIGSSLCVMRANLLCHRSALCPRRGSRRPRPPDPRPHAAPASSSSDRP